MPEADALTVAFRFAAALGLGVLIGLERERSQPETRFAGVRTFGLISLAGAMAAFLDGALGRPSLGLVLFAAVAALVVVSAVLTARQGGDIGITTEISVF